MGLALGAALSWGVSDFLGGVTSRRLPLLWVLFFTQAVGLAIALPIALLRTTPSFETPTLLAALGFGGFFILLHEASAHDVFWAVSVQRATGAAVMGLLLLARRPAWA